MYFIYFRNHQGWLCSTIHHKPLTEIYWPTGEWIDGEDGEPVADRRPLPCKHINLQTRKKS